MRCSELLRTFPMNRFKAAMQAVEEIKKSFAHLTLPVVKLSEETQATMRQVQEHLVRVPDEMRPLSTALAQRGWYMSMDMPFRFLYTLRHLLDTGKVSETDELIVAYLDHHRKELEKVILETFPSRAAVLSAAFRSHRRKDYVLAVPVFLAQADGICAEILGVGFYSRSKGRPKTAPLVERFASSSLMSSLLEPLRVAGALNAYEDERHQYPDILNRHEVLHGKSVDYATRLNSFRALSPLSYLHTTLFTAKEFQEFQDEKAQSESTGA